MLTLSILIRQTTTTILDVLCYSYFAKVFHTSAKFASSVKIGYLESEFLKHLVHLEDLEPLGGEEVLVWHTRTEAVNLNKEKEFTKKHQSRSHDFPTTARFMELWNACHFKLHNAGNG